MPLLNTELQLDDVTTISIPTDAILMLSLLIVFALLGYFFHNILDNQTNQFVEKVDDNSNLELVKEKLEDNLTLESKTINYKKSERPNIKKLNFLPPSKFLGIGGFAVLAIGGASILGLQNIQKSYEGVNTSRTNIKLENQSTKSQLSIVELKQLDKIKLKQISYIDPFFLPMKSSKYNHNYQVKEKQIENNFSF